MTKEILLTAPDPSKWVRLDRAGGMLVNVLWEDPETGASISLLDIPEGAGATVKHVHASNQFMYCLEGEFEYVATGLVLRPGSFYMNPKGHPHGPTRANRRSLLLEIYDGAHYYETPPYHTEETVGKIADRKQAGE